MGGGVTQDWIPVKKYTLLRVSVSLQFVYSLTACKG